MRRFKKILSILMILAITACMAVLSQSTVSAAGGSLSGTGTVRAGDTISVTLSVSGPNAYGCEASFSYDSSVLTYKSHKQNTSWGLFSFNSGNLTLATSDTSESKPITSSGSIVTLTFKVANNLPVGTNVSVKVSGKVSVKTDGGFSSSGFSSTYSKKVSSPLSTNARLSSLTISNATISPAFSADVNAYTCSVPFETESLAITAKAQDASSKVSISGNSLVAGATTNVTVNVTAPSGAVNTYTIKATRAQDPNYVADSNSTLSSLVVDGFSISPAFTPEVLEYVVWLPFEKSSIDIYPEATSAKSTFSVSENVASLAEGENIVTVSVTAEDGSITEYKVLAVRNAKYTSYEEYMAAKMVVSAPEEQQPSPNEETPSQSQNMPLWSYVLICFFCLVAGFFGCMMLPRKKAFRSETDDYNYDESEIELEVAEEQPVETVPQTDGFGISDIFKDE